MNSLNFYLIGRDCRYSWIKAPQLEAIGLQPAELIGQDFREVIDKAHRRVWEPHFFAALEKDVSAAFFYQSKATGLLDMFNVYPAGNAVLTIVTEMEKQSAKDLSQALSFHQEGEQSEALVRFFERVGMAAGEPDERGLTA